MLIKNLPNDSAVLRELHGESADWSVGDHLLAAAVDHLAVANWMFACVNTGEDDDPPEPPQPVPRPGTGSGSDGDTDPDSDDEDGTQAGSGNENSVTASSATTGGAVTPVALARFFG
ncbi:hypothetical protein SLA_4539 [Streptomyces laurentii]|uniref:Uncharacterized protein n=1 Tax=Streptomyces laurentii TaxID=39478 RepID=A0A160P4A0_STRLU|nr:hypothetical protein SLA_4539 [Streptomyces laurentii]